MMDTNKLGDTSDGTSNVDIPPIATTRMMNSIARIRRKSMSVILEVLTIIGIREITIVNVT